MLAWTQNQVQLRHLGMSADDAGQFQALGGLVTYPAPGPASGCVDAGPRPRRPVRAVVARRLRRPADRARAHRRSPGPQHRPPGRPGVRVLATDPAPRRSRRAQRSFVVVRREPARRPAGPRQPGAGRRAGRRSARRHPPRAHRPGGPGGDPGARRRGPGDDRCPAEATSPTRYVGHWSRARTRSLVAAPRSRACPPRPRSSPTRAPRICCTSTGSVGSTSVTASTSSCSTAPTRHRPRGRTSWPTSSSASTPPPRAPGTRGGATVVTTSSRHGATTPSARRCPRRSTCATTPTVRCARRRRGRSPRAATSPATASAPPSTSINARISDSTSTSCSSSPCTTPMKISRLRLTNRGPWPASFTVTWYAELVLGQDRQHTADHLVTEHDTETRALFVRNPWSTQYADQVVFADLAGQQTAWTGDRREFLGATGTMEWPNGVVSGPAVVESRRCRRRSRAGAAAAGVDRPRGDGRRDDPVRGRTRRRARPVG